MFADQNPRRLLLLRLWLARVKPTAREELCGDGLRHDRRHLVSYRSKVLALFNSPEKYRKTRILA